MPVSLDYVAATLRKLEAVRPVTSKRMFGGVGLYCDGAFFGVMDDDRLFFKVDDSNSAKYEKVGAQQWIPDPVSGTKMPYYEVPDRVLKGKALAEWIDGAVEVAKRKKAKKMPDST